MGTRDLTRGSIKGHLIYLMIPLIFGNILQQLYNTIDALVLGRFAGAEEFAAIGISGAVMNLFLFAIVGATTGISVIFAQAYGAGDVEKYRNAHFHTLIIGLTVTIAGSIIAIFLMRIILGIIQTPIDLVGYVEDYLIIIFVFLPVTYIYNMYTSLLRSVGNTKMPLLMLAISVGINLGLDVLFIARFDMGIRGAAWATAIAQAISAVSCVLYMRFAMQEFMFTRKNCRLDLLLAKKIIHFGFVTGIHQSGLYIGKLLVQGAVNTGGTELISAYTATTRIEGFANSFGDSGAAATSVVTAQNLGAKKHDRVLETYRASIIILFILGIVCSAIMALTAELTVGFVLGQKSGTTFDSAKQYIILISVFYVLCFMGNTFAGFFEGIGKVIFPFIGAATHITIRVILSWLFIGQGGLNTVAIATGIGWIYVNILWETLYVRQKRRIKGLQTNK